MLALLSSRAVFITLAGRQNLFLVLSFYVPMYTETREFSAHLMGQTLHRLCRMTDGKPWSTGVLNILLWVSSVWSALLFCILLASSWSLYCSMFISFFSLTFFFNQYCASYFLSLGDFSKVINGSEYCLFLWYYKIVSRNVCLFYRYFSLERIYLFRQNSDNKTSSQTICILNEIFNLKI